MAAKVYSVMKDGKELEQFKTLTAAKKLANAEGGEVFYDGKCVYKANTQSVEKPVDKAVNKDVDSETVKENQAVELLKEPDAAATEATVTTEATEAIEATVAAVTTESTEATTVSVETTEVKGATEATIVPEKPAEQPYNDKPRKAEPEKYRLKALMNVRRAPSMSAAVLSMKAAGTVVYVMGVEKGWLHLTDGSYILFQDGRWAEKIG